jgi:hypothetical protein
VNGIHEGTERLGPPPGGKIIPLMPGVARGAADRRAMLRDAVLQLVGHLVLRAVPPSARLPLFDQARTVLDEAGWGLDELARAAEPGPAQDELLRALGLLELATAPASTPGPSGGDGNEGSKTNPPSPNAPCAFRPGPATLPPAHEKSRLIREVTVATDGNSRSSI